MLEYRSGLEEDCCSVRTYTGARGLCVGERLFHRRPRCRRRSDMFCRCLSSLGGPDVMMEERWARR